MKINLREGINRLFIVFSVVAGFFIFCSLHSNHNSILLSAIVSCAVIVFIYISFFVLSWIVAGFTGEESKETGIKGFITKFFENYKSFNFILFLFSLSICVYLAIFSTMTIDDNKKTNNELINCKSQNYEYEQILK
jgi:hypothetical protein